MSGSRILVLGAAGFIGSHLCKSLASEDYAFDAVDNLSNSSPARFNSLLSPHGCFELTVSDLQAFLDVAKHDYSHVIDLAYINGTRQFYRRGSKILKSAVSNVDASSSFAEKIGAHFFYAGTPESYGHPEVFPTPEFAKLSVPDVKNPRWSYSIGKTAAENLLFCKLAETSWDAFTIFRPNNAYGPFDAMHVIPELTAKLLGPEEYLEVLGAPSDTRSFCYVDDMVAMILALIRKCPASQIYNVGSPVETSIGELVEDLMAIYGVRKPVKWVDPMRGNPSRRIPDVSRIQEISGVVCRSLNEGLKLTKEIESDLTA